MKPHSLKHSFSVEIYRNSSPKSGCGDICGGQTGRSVGEETQRRCLGDPDILKFRMSLRSQFPSTLTLEVCVFIFSLCTEYSLDIYHFIGRSLLHIHQTGPAMIPQKQIPTTAFVVEKPGAPFVLQDVVLDEVRANEVLVEMKYTGLCHTVCIHNELLQIKRDQQNTLRISSSNRAQSLSVIILPY